MLPQGGRKSRQSEGGDPGIQIFVEPRSAPPATPVAAATAVPEPVRMQQPPSRQPSGLLQHLPPDRRPSGPLLTPAPLQNIPPPGIISEAQLASFRAAALGSGGGGAPAGFSRGAHGGNSGLPLHAEAGQLPAAGSWPADLAAELVAMRQAVSGEMAYRAALVAEAARERAALEAQARFCFSQ